MLQEESCLPLPPSSSGGTSARAAGHDSQRTPTVLQEQHPICASRQEGRIGPQFMLLQGLIFFYRITRKISYLKMHFGNTANFILHKHCSASLTPFPKITEQLLQH